jgi:SAM-dependent methyltransferase
MPDPETDETRRFWDGVADDWLIQVGASGDDNRRLHSDPVIWSFLGDAAGRRILDAGCGVGYLTKQLQDRGAVATGVDLSARMVAIARRSYPEIDFRVDSCAELRCFENASFDALVSNYVVMDIPDLEGTARAFHRVLRPGGVAAVVISHPCFPQGPGRIAVEDGCSAVTYRWTDSYFERARRIDPPWGHFQSDFIWFHRPLSDYWKAFRAAGFAVDDFAEPRLAPGRRAEAAALGKLEDSLMRPYSAAFKLARLG